MLVSRLAEPGYSRVTNRLSALLVSTGRSTYVADNLVRPRGVLKEVQSTLMDLNIDSGCVFCKAQEH